MSNTFVAIVQELLKRLTPDEQFIVQRATGTGAAAGASLIDARISDNRSDADSTKFVNNWVRIPAQTTPAWSEECIRQVGAFTASTGTLTPIDPFGFSYDGVGVTTDNTTLTDTGRTWTTNEHVGNVVTCNSKAMTVTSNTGSVLTGASWSGGGNPGNAYPYTITRIVPADTQYEIHRSLAPPRLQECINRALRSMRRRLFGGFTELTDGDMETALYANWTATNCTPSKITTAAYVRYGTQSLRVLNTVANGYVQSAALPVIEGQRWLIPAFMRSAVGTGTLIPWDVTNGAAITTTGTGWSSDESAWTELGGEIVTIPSGCESMAIRLRGTGATDDIYWDCALPVNVDDAILKLPSWLDQEDYLLGLLTFPQGKSASGGGYEVDQAWEEKAFDWLPLVDEAAANPWRIQVETPITRPLFIRAMRPWAELSVDADTTNVDLDVVVTRAMAFVEELLGNLQQKLYWEGEASGLQRDHGKRPKVIQRTPYTSTRAP